MHTHGHEGESMKALTDEGDLILTPEDVAGRIECCNTFPRPDDDTDDDKVMLLTTTRRKVTKTNNYSTSLLLESPYRWQD